MKYGEFEDWVQKNCMYETFYVDSEGRSILVIRQMDAWGMCKDRKSTRLNSSHSQQSRMPSSA